MTKAVPLTLVVGLGVLAAALVSSGAGVAGTDSAKGSATLVDLSSPEKYVKAMTAIPASLTDEEVVFLFYTDDAARVLVTFDRFGSAALKQFGLFKEAFRKRFPERIVAEEEHKLTVAAQWPQPRREEKTAAFWINASLVAPQLRARKPGDIVFLKSRETHGVVTAEVVIVGQKTTLNMVRQGEKYKGTVRAEDLRQIKQLTGLLALTIPVLQGFSSELDNRTVNAQNYEQRIAAWGEQYEKALSSTK